MEELGNNNITSDQEADGNNLVKRDTNENIESEKTINVLISHLKKHDCNELKRSAISKGGLINDGLRRKIWPYLLKLDVFSTSPKPTTEVIESHHYYSQVVMDVNRSLKRFPPSIAEKQRLSMQDQLVALIMRVLIKHPDLHYYQGYHDICVTFLLVLGEERAFSVIEKLSTTNLRLFMDKTMQRTSDHLQHIYPLIRRVSPQLHAFMQRSEVGVMFCLSWVITWYGHVLEDYDTVVRIFDLFLASHSWMPLYLAAAIVIHREKDILKLDCDMACVHSFLGKLTDNLPFEKLIVDARDLFKEFPPEVLENDLKLEEHRKAGRRRSLVGNAALTLKKAVGCIFPYSISSKTLPILVVIAAVVIYQIYKRYK